METLRGALGKFGLPLLAVFLICWALVGLGLAIPEIVLIILALLSGLLILIST